MVDGRRLTRRNVLKAFGAGAGIAAGAPALSSATAAKTGLTIDMNNGDGALRHRDERCNLSDNVLGERDVAIGEQVRVRCADDDATYESGLFTVVGDSRKRDTVEMSKDGLDRLGFEKRSGGSVRTYAPHPDYATREEASENDEFVEILRDDGEQSALVACAPHGGWIEYPTDRQSARVADALGVTEWTCAGYNSGGGAFDRWHITSTAISPRSFPELGTIADRGFDHAVSFHGFTQSGVAVGGGAPESVRRDLRDAIDAATDGRYDVYLADEDGPYAGQSSNNFVNWLTADGNGIQVEQSWDARVDDWRTIADAVSEFYADRL